MTTDEIRILENIFMELQASGATLDMGQLAWAIETFQDRVRERDLDAQFRAEQIRKLVLPSTRDEYCEERGITAPGY
jgi:hypothetical protein